MEATFGLQGLETAWERWEMRTKF